MGDLIEMWDDRHPSGGQVQAPLYYFPVEAKTRLTNGDALRRIANIQFLTNFNDLLLSDIQRTPYPNPSI